ncbi:MAG: beta-N-acetylhexosaminidase [Clostridia bacterium]|nr:beta-N-acetylhexosaminidase [Clostridia bacterium]
MKIIIKNTCEYVEIIKEAISDTIAEWGEGGLVIEAIPCTREKGLRISSDGKNATVHYSSLTALLRAVGILISYGDEPFTKEEKLRFNYLGNMVDCSRNAVVNLDTLKKIIRSCSLMGHNCMMLYTEDTYEIPSEKYFGHMRGRYSQNELRELDAYAERFGIELMPCIQTLAHLEGMFAWPAMQKYRDIENIMNVADEEVYELIDKMLESMSKSLKSRKINVGMDEAHLLGRGKYLDKAGYSERVDIMYKHLQRVVEICKKYGYEPLIWDDMFFRVNSPNGSYYKGFVTEKEASLVPPEVNLVYWDYSWPNIEPYTEMLEKHKVFKNNKISFAGGSFCWYGGVLQTAFAMNASRSALTAIFNNTVEMDVVLITEWGDDGAYTPITASLPIMIMYGEGAWAGDLSDETVDKRLRVFGEALEDFYAMDDVNFTPEIEHIRGRDIMLTHNYLLHQDVLLGLWDYHAPVNPCEHYRRTAERMRAIADKKTPLSHVYDAIEKLALALELKANLGIRTKDAYDKDDKEELRKIALEVIPECIKRMRAFGNAFRYQWRLTNKDYGIEVFDTRLGGAIYRLEDVAEVLLAYVDGKRDSINELEQERLPFHTYGKEKNVPISCFYIQEAQTVGRLI